MAAPDGPNISPPPQRTPPPPQGPAPQNGGGSDSFSRVPAYADRPNAAGSFERPSQRVPEHTDAPRQGVPQEQTFSHDRPLFGSSNNRNFDGIGAPPPGGGGGDQPPTGDETEGGSDRPRGLYGRVGRATEKAGKAMERGANVAQGAGNVAQAAGKGTKAAGQATEMAGKGLEAGGKLAQKGGQAMMRAGQQLSGTGWGAIIGVPLMAAGGLTAGAGAAAQAGGKGAQAAGKGAQRAGETIDKAGQKTKDVAKKVKEQGKAAQEKGKALQERAAGKGKAATNKAAQGNPVAGVADDLKKLAMGPRPSNKEIIRMLGRLLEYAAQASGLEVPPGTVEKVIWVAEKSKLLTSADEKRIATAVWPEEDQKRFNPLHVSLPKLIRALQILQIKAYVLATISVLLSLLVAFLLVLVMIAAFCQFGPVYYASKGVGYVSSAASAVGLKGVASFIDAYNFCKPINDAVDAAVSGSSSTKTASGTPTVAGAFAPGGNQCSVLTVGPASSAQLRSSCFGTNAAAASGIARQESGGDPTSLSAVRVCVDDKQPFAIGLYHLDLTTTSLTDPTTGQSLDCPAAFIRSTPFASESADGTLRYNCRVVNQTLYQQCVHAAQDPRTNISVACTISKNGTDWSAWPAANQVCKF